MKSCSKLKAIITALVVAITSAFFTAPSHAEDVPDLNGAYAGSIVFIEQTGNDLKIHFADGMLGRGAIGGQVEAGNWSLTIAYPNGAVHNCSILRANEVRPMIRDNEGWGMQGYKK